MAGIVRDTSGAILPGVSVEAASSGGATPVVDTQTSTKREVVLSNEVLAAVPATRTYGIVLAMVPGVQSLTLDVNSTQSMTGTATNFFSRFNVTFNF